MKRTVKVFPAMLVLGLIVFGLTATNCEKEEDYDAVTYYDAIGEGWVFQYDSSSLSPVQGAVIVVTTSLEGGSWLSPPNPKETFITDVDGKYQVRFIKRTHLANARNYYFEMSHYWGGNGGNGDFVVSVSEVKNAKIISLPTIKVGYYNGY